MNRTLSPADPGASASAGALGGRELRLRAMSSDVIFGPGAGSRSSGGLTWRWVTENGWSPRPDDWYSSPEAALEAFE